MKRKHRGIESNSSKGIKVPKRGDLHFYYGVYEDGLDVPVMTVRAVLSNGLGLTRFHYRDERSVKWRLWHTDDVFFSKNPNSRLIAQYPKGSFIEFPSGELEHWLTDTRFGYAMNLFEATLAASDLHALMDQYGEQFAEAEASKDRLTAYRMKLRLRKTLREPHTLLCSNSA